MQLDSANHYKIKIIQFLSNVTTIIIIKLTRHDIIRSRTGSFVFCHWCIFVYQMIITTKLKLCIVALSLRAKLPKYNTMLKQWLGRDTLPPSHNLGPVSIYKNTFPGTCILIIKKKLPREFIYRRAYPDTTCFAWKRIISQVENALIKTFVMDNITFVVI